jgi:HK97 family phage prohead protease
MKKDFTAEPQYTRRIHDIAELEVKEVGGDVIIRGYANTKGNKDSYGDIPTVMPQLRNFVYDLDRFKKNPVMLIDHYNSISHVAGSFVEHEEDDKGLRVAGKFSNSDYPLIKHARTVYKEKHAKAFSIGGWFAYEDKDHPEHLTYVKLMEISLVGIGADEFALGTAYDKAVSMVDQVEKAFALLSDEQKDELMEKVKSINVIKKEVMPAAKNDEVSREAIQSVINSLKGSEEVCVRIMKQLNPPK